MGTRIKQSGFTFSRKIQLKKVAVHFLGIYSIKQSDCTPFNHIRSELNSRTLSRRLAVSATISAWQTPDEMPETLL